ncbi:hypothetical protein Aab01nite_19310 [Paractinoplanes abujensis]|uniref:Pimeloyl-ACP methyl ester carboxylesterase n=1 Tax=Paractinoplanes abujensis TaxID=882441 RepID=A0A7W7CYX2_9ACTN|nr:alpha/beta fold hydrolase [Actinoplanes abujensis]MBB4697186.1 pimeloyl-ACP methyl ester carboxylesterase [Actinoplanes abujensis]GID18341.1 hypothetical protein Aab01nite_19310 [Actinoplanes abujensis]
MALVVVLHGLAGSANEMAPLAARLTAAGHRVLVPDQRGHGHHERHPADVSRAAYVADVVALLDEPAFLVGQSMGAHTAMLTAAANPSLVRGLVMIEGGVGGSTDDYPERLRAYFASWPVPFADEAAARSFLGDRPITEAWIADFERRPDGLWPRFDPGVMKAAIAPVAAVARWREWESLTVPVLQILGEHGAIPPGEVERMAARRVVVPGVGHDVHLEAPDETARLILDFLAERPLAGGFVSDVVQIGETVRKSPPRDPEFVRRLLRHFELQDWSGAPRFLGIDDQGREMLSFVQGDVWWRPEHEPPSLRSPESLAAVARLVRQFQNWSSNREHERPAGASTGMTARIRPVGSDGSTTGTGMVVGADDLAGMFSRYGRDLQVYCTRRVGPQLAEDVVAETFLVAHERRDKFDPRRGELLGKLSRQWLVPGRWDLRF